MLSRSRLALLGAAIGGMALTIILVVTYSVIARKGVYETARSVDTIASEFGGLLSLFAASLFGLLIARAYHKKTNLELALLEMDRDRAIEKARIVNIERTELQSVITELRDHNTSLATSAGHRFTTALPVASMGPDGPLPFASRAETVFGERKFHFAMEKEFLCEILAEAIAIRAKALIDEYQKNVVVIVDSGTTLYPLFEKLSRRIVRQSILEQHPPGAQWWGSRIRVVTNSIAGIESLILHGRASNEDRYSEIVSNAEIVAGTPLAVYSAAVGPLAIAHIEALGVAPRDVDSRRPRFDEHRPLHVIAITTGNYVFLKHDGTPVPIARGEGHKEFKEAVCKKADEVFVVGPLGKFLNEGPDVHLDAFNKDLHFAEDHWLHNRRPYKSVEIPGNRPVSVLTTSRTHADHIFFRHSTAVVARLNAPVKLVSAEGLLKPDVLLRLERQALTSPLHIVAEFTDLPQSRSYQFNVEIPHKNLREKELLRRYFDITVQ